MDRPNTHPTLILARRSAVWGDYPRDVLLVLRLVGLKTLKTLNLWINMDSSALQRRQWLAAGDAVWRMRGEPPIRACVPRAARNDAGLLQPIALRNPARKSLDYLYNHCRSRANRDAFRLESRERETFQDAFIGGQLMDLRNLLRGFAFHSTEISRFRNVLTQPISRLVLNGAFWGELQWRC